MLQGVSYVQISVVYIRNPIPIRTRLPRWWSGPYRVGLCCIFEGMLAARFHKLVVVIEVADER
jgi:hypothetical protein